MYVVDLIYLKPLAEIEACTAVHREYLDRHYEAGIFLASGPKIPRNGGVIIVHGRLTRPELEAILDHDPFSLQGLVRYEITEFNPVKHHRAIAELL